MIKEMRKLIIGLITSSKRFGLIALCSSFLSLLVAALSIVIPFLFGEAIDSIGDKSIIEYLIISLILIVITSLLMYIMDVLNSRLSMGFTRKLREDSYSKIGRLKMKVIDTISIGKIESLLINDIETIGDGINLFLSSAFKGIATIVFTFLVLLYINPLIAILILVFTPLSFFVSGKISKTTFSLFKSQASIRAEQTSVIHESISNYKISYLSRTRESTVTNFNKINDNYRDVSSKATFISSIVNPSTRFINSLIYALVALIGALTSSKGALTIGMLSTILYYASSFMKPFNELSSVFTEISEAVSCYDRVLNLQVAEEISDERSESINFSSSNFTIEFKNVCFSYVKGKEILHDVSFKVDNKTSLAIVGPTGCGKTTIINLLMKFYEPDKGEILINDIPISKINRDELRKFVGIVTQDTWFTNGSIMDNISYGNSMLSVDEAIEISRKSGAHSFIRRLQNKYDEKIDPLNEEISEGQRQLLSITRAMASDSPILILDEATSSVDIYTEHKIHKDLRELMNDRTSIVIAHRLKTIINSDKIIVLENGRVTESGTHDELIRNGGFYLSLYKSYTEN